jgi:hypothetical protein
MSDAWKKNWNYDAEEKTDSRPYVIRSGDRVVARVDTRGDADLICRARRESVRQASRIAFDTRQHLTQVQNLRGDIRLLLGMLNQLANALKENARRRDVTAAREKATKVLRTMKARGHTI